MIDEERVKNCFIELSNVFDNFATWEILTMLELYKMNLIKITIEDTLIKGEKDDE